MNENLKTSVFLLIGLCFAGVAWNAWPRTPQAVKYDDSGERFFAAFNPLSAARLEITRFDDQTAAPRTFEVARRDGVWSLPSNEDYPADAAKQMAEAAAGIVDMVKGSSVSDTPADHELYGVVDPSAAQPGAQGVGTRVKLADAAGAALADVVIGKTVKDNPEYRYARTPTRDRVYVARVSTDKLSMSFGDWIEKDLLKLDAGALQHITVNAYSIDELNQRMIQGDLIELARPAGGEWTLEGLGPAEQVSSNQIEQLTQALMELKIVDVHRKPAGLSRELQAVEPMRLDEAAVNSLAMRGYYVVNGQLLSNEGEVIVELNTGVRYVLRFGEIASIDAPLTDAETEAPAEPAAGNNRYLFIMAQLDESLIPRAKLQDVPAVPAPIPMPTPKEGEPAPTAAEHAEMQKMIDGAVQQARAKTEESNAREQSRYDAALKAATETVNSLNARFADWYYVISDDVYRRIRVARADLIEPAPPAAPDRTPAVDGGLPGPG
jgi:Domain of unknown function (DUF4340)